MNLILFLSIPFFILFFFLAYFSINTAIFLIILFLPTYIIRFNVGIIPTTILEASLVAFFLAWMIKYAKEDFASIKFFIKKYRIFFIFIFLFLVSSIVSIFIAGLDTKNYALNTYKAFGLWRAYFFEPIIFFFIIIARSKKNKNLISILLNGLIFSSAIVSLLAIIQKATGILFPPSLLDDNLFGRVTSFFTSPNAIGLYTALSIPLAINQMIEKPRLNTKILFISIIFIDILAIILAWSQGAWVALVAGATVYFYHIGLKKITLATIIVGILVAITIPTLKTALMFKDTASKNRLILWDYSFDFLKKSPKNFFFGTGLRQFFPKIQRSNPDYNPKKLEPIIYPHNIILNFWTETGALGATSFMAILFYLFIISYKIYKKEKIFGASILSALTIFLIHGIVDVPYLKNDLAIIFWILPAIILIKNNDSFVKESLNISRCDKKIA